MTRLVLNLKLQRCLMALCHGNITILPVNVIDHKYFYWAETLSFLLSLLDSLNKYFLVLELILYYCLIPNCGPISYKCCWYSQVQIHIDIPNHDFLGEMKLDILRRHHLPTTRYANDFKFSGDSFIIKSVLWVGIVIVLSWLVLIKIKHRIRSKSWIWVNSDAFGGPCWSVFASL